MLEFIKQLPFLRRLERVSPDPDALVEEKWTFDFARPRLRRFEEETQPTYSAFFAHKALVLRLTQAGRIAWVEDPLYRYADLALEGELRFEAGSGYAAAGFQFRRADEHSYYSLLVSVRGYFRLDVIFNGSPMHLIGWTEIPDFEPYGKPPIRLRLIALGDRITVVINNRWSGEIVDDTIPSGKIGFTLASYEADPDRDAGSAFCCGAVLERLNIDSRSIQVEALHLRWNTLIKVDPAARFSLAGTFSAMGQPMSALVQLKRAWKRPGRQRTQPELLLAATCALQLSLLEEAEDYLDRCVEADSESGEARRALAEKAKLLYLDGRFGELKTYAEEALRFFPEDATLHTLLGHAFSHLGAFSPAAAAYDAALQKDPDNGLVAQNAAQAYEKLALPAQAVERYLRAGQAFLRDERYADLGLIIPRLAALDGARAETHALAGKRAYALEAYPEAEKELNLALDRRTAGEAEDPAISFLLGLLKMRRGHLKKALSFLERSVELAPDYGPFRFKAAECRFLAGNDPEDPRLAADLAAALRLGPEDGWTANLAGQIALAGNRLDRAAEYLAQAAARLGPEPAVRTNQAELAFRRGDQEAALALVTVEAGLKDAQGILANKRGNLLVRSGRFEEADAAYRQALAEVPDNIEYLRNRASCLVELAAYGEADAVLAKAYEIEPSPRILELIAYVAAKKGEYPRAETACRLALETAPEDTAILSSLAWIYLTMARWAAAAETIDRLERAVKPGSAEAAGARDLRRRLDDATTRVIPCAGCGRSWRVARDQVGTGPLRLVAEPPEDLPAGTCPTCGKTWCIGCAKNALDPDGRFVCPDCGQRLKLFDEGLKKLLADWAAGR